MSAGSAWRALIGVFVLLASMAGVGAAAAAETRIALVIEQNKYRGNLSPLPGVKSEADALASALTSLRFQVTRKSDLDRPGLEDAIKSFRRSLAAKPGAIGFIYYTGHGARDPSDDGADNYLLGVEADLEVEADLVAYGVRLGDLTRQMAATGARAVVIVADACRNTPTLGKAGAKGFAPIANDTNTLVAYATDLGQIADVGVYAPILARELVKPGRDLAQVFSEVQVEVARSTGHKQRPWTSNRIYERICLAGCEGGPEPPPPPPPRRDPDAEAWDAVTRDCDAKAYLREYPSGTFAAAARIRAARCDEAARPPPPLPAPAAASGYSEIGKDFRTLTLTEGQWNDAASPHTCENAFARIPSGWRVASAERAAVVGRFTKWDTHVIVAANGEAYHTRNYGSAVPGGRYGGANYLSVSGDTAKTTLCSAAVLLEREAKQGLPIKDADGRVVHDKKLGVDIAPPAPPPPAPSYAYVGKDFRTLKLQPGDWNLDNRSARTCESAYGDIPSGWTIASPARTQTVAQITRFNTDVLVASDGTAWNTRAFSGQTPGKRWSSGSVLSRSGAQVKTTGCTMAILLERSDKTSLPIRDAQGGAPPAPPAQDNYSDIGSDFRTLTQQPSQWDRDESNRTCENASMSIPSGWRIASPARTQAVARETKWNTDILVASDGTAYNTRDYSGMTPGGKYASVNLLQSSGGAAKTTLCSAAVLLERDGRSAYPIPTPSKTVIYRP